MKFKESIRKTIHLSSLIIPFGYRYVLNYNRNLMFSIMLVVFILMLVIEFYRLWQKSFRKTFWLIFGMVLRHKELYDFTGATYLLFSSVICIAFFPPEITFFALCFLSLGDTSAALVGLNFGKRKYKNNKKTLEGSLACFIVCFVFALCFKANTIIALIGALGATLAEASRVPIDDNIKIPVFSAILMVLADIFV